MATRRKITVCVVYHKDQYYLSGKHFDNTFYRFFFDGFDANERIDATQICVPTGDFDCRRLKRFDVVFFYPCKGGWWKVALRNPEAIKGRKWCICPDPHATTFGWFRKYRDIGVSNIFYGIPKQYVETFIPKDFTYHRIVMGVDKNIFGTGLPYKSRCKGVIALAGAYGDDYFYKLRRLCTKIPYVEYFNRCKANSGNNFFAALSLYQAAIAACTQYVVTKYFEMMASGCTTFVECNDKNGWEGYGFIDGENCIAINETNYIQKFDEYINEPDNPRWERIAKCGREFVMENYENQVQINKLIDLVMQT